MTSIDNDIPHPFITAAAAQVARADAELSERQRVMDAKAVDFQAIERRVTALKAARAEIAARRAAGDPREGDAREVALLDMDLGSLAEQLATAKAAVSDAKRQRDEAMRRAEFARAEMTKVEDRVALDALLDHANNVCATLEETLAEIGEIGRRVGVLNYTWTPPAALMQRLRRAELSRRPA